MVSFDSRTGRQFQRYDRGCRQVVGCIPYRFRQTTHASPNDGRTLIQELEVLVISSQKSQRLMFPKGGWEIDESMTDAALRETREEAGVEGEVQRELGKWSYNSKRNGAFHEGYMFSLLVEKQLDHWPEKNLRQRKWMTADEARKLCMQSWMKEALEKLISLQQKGDEDENIKNKANY
ncbi:hypothetical protein L1049_028403 [Liquidambar formosana]|uniref:Nudix hydrolase domain-containing protein n=1 Tax=Liquidambar formosana TaxID=63359 RepID=A0AAP0RKL7_LIQFO